MKHAAQTAITQVAEKGAASGLMASTPELASGMESHASWPVVAQFATMLSVAVPLNNLRVRDLLSLQPNQVFQTSWACGGDVPVSIGPCQVAWGEFDVLNENIALRITRLA